jgi:hypothetical protein
VTLRRKSRRTISNFDLEIRAISLVLRGISPVVYSPPMAYGGFVVLSL